MSGVWLITTDSWVDDDGEEWGPQVRCACRTEDQARKTRDVMQPYEPAQLFVSWVPFVKPGEVQRVTKLVVSVEPDGRIEERTLDCWSFHALPLDDFVRPRSGGYRADGSDHDAVRQAVAHYLETGQAST